MSATAYSAAKVAEELEISVNRVYEMARKGEIPAVRIGGLWRFPVARLAEWLEQDGQVASNSTLNRGRVAS